MLLRCYIPPGKLGVGVGRVPPPGGNRV